MRWKLPPLNSLKAFEAVGRHLSVTRAAEELSVTPGAVSKQIRLLEDYLGTTLFQRSGKNTFLTENGKSYHESIVYAFMSMHESTQKHSQNNTKNSICICSTMTFSLRWIIPKLVHFQSEYPEFLFDIKMINTWEDFDSVDYDVAIFLGPARHRSADCIKLFKPMLVPVCSPELLQSKTITCPGDLVHHTLLHSTARPNAWNAWLEKYAPDIKVDRAIYLPSSCLTYEAASDGMGVAIAQRRLIAEELRSGRLVVPIEDEVEEEMYYYLYVSKASTSRGVLRFRDWILRMVREP